MSSKLSHCRFCGESNKIDNLLDLSTDEKILEDYCKKLEFLKIDFINLHSNILSKTICGACRKSLQDCCDFYLKIKQAQTAFNKLHKNSEHSFEFTLIKQENIDEKGENSSPDHELVIDIPESDFKFDTHPYKDLINPQPSCNLKKRRHIFNPTIVASTNKKRKIDHSSTLQKFDTCTKVSTDFKILSLGISWIDYDWRCVHCGVNFDSKEELRDHSKTVHGLCYGFKCMDCEELFNYFNPFIEHVRLHRESLRLYCQFCNMTHLTPELTLTHSITHYRNSQICELCGESFASAAALNGHRKAYKKLKLPQRYYKKKPQRIKCDISWNEYEWTCQYCNLRVASASHLRRHARDEHGKCFAMRCADCLQVMNNFKQFVEHATAHRSCLKDYCQYCNARPDDLAKHLSAHHTDSKPCEGCGDLFHTSAELAQHMTVYDAPRVRGLCSNESLTCGVCHKYFPNASQLKTHKVIHNSQRERDQICHNCGKAFYDAKTLTSHLKCHFSKTETCDICKKTFHTKQRLKTHIQTHVGVKQFVCNECGKEFRRKSQLSQHLVSHSDVLPFQCNVCQKSFRLMSYLTIHERQHTGIRPFTCEICKETFTHWGNCNRHMLRKHGVTLAKTKLTKHGKIDINRETGEAKKIDISGDAKVYCDEMLRPMKRGRKRKNEKN